MKTYYLELTKRQQQEIEENRKKGRCTVMQPLVRDGKSSLLRCCVISDLEMKAVNAGIEASRKMPNSEVSQNAADKPKLKLLQTTRINLK